MNLEAIDTEISINAYTLDMWLSIVHDLGKQPALLIQHSIELLRSLKDHKLNFTIYEKTKQEDKLVKVILPKQSILIDKQNATLNISTVNCSYYIAVPIEFIRYVMSDDELIGYQFVEELSFLNSEGHYTIVKNQNTEPKPKLTLVKD